MHFLFGRYSSFMSSTIGGGRGGGLNKRSFCTSNLAFCLLFFYYSLTRFIWEFNCVWCFSRLCALVRGVFAKKSGSRRGRKRDIGSERERRNVACLEYAAKPRKGSKYSEIYHKLWSKSTTTAHKQASKTCIANSQIFTECAASIDVSWNCFCSSSIIVVAGVSKCMVGKTFTDIQTFQQNMQ